MATSQTGQETDTRAWLRHFVRPLRPIFREVLVMSLFINLLALAVPVFSLQVYDRVVFHAGLSTLQGLAIGILFVIVFDNVLRQARSRIMQKAALRLDIGVGRKLFSKLLALPLGELENRPNAHCRPCSATSNCCATRSRVPPLSWLPTFPSPCSFWR